MRVLFHVVVHRLKILAIGRGGGWRHRRSCAVDHVVGFKGLLIELCRPGEDLGEYRGLLQSKEFDRGKRVLECVSRDPW